jgi:hypothetical protein
MKVAEMNISLDEAIKRWNEGDQIWSVELGGIGPGYEQIIQILTFEFVSRWEKKPILNTTDFRNHCDKVTAELNEKLQGPTGAQHGAAEILAYKFIHDGYSEVLQSVRNEARLILVSKSFPTL